TFSSTATSDFHQYTLPLDQNLVADLSAGGMVSLHLSPVSSNIGFNFSSRSFVIADDRPQLLVSAAGSTPGDINCDGLVDSRDVPAFVLALLDPAAYAAAYPNCSLTRADLDRDGTVAGSDIPAFVGLLLGP